MADMTVPNTILEQLGGRRRLEVMTGSKSFVGGEKYLAFKLGSGAKVPYIKITLDPSDTYTLDGYRIRKSEYQSLKKVEGVYVEQLHEIFTEITGFYLTLR